jgi:hypothetical protein
MDTDMEMAEQALPIANGKACVSKLKCVFQCSKSGNLFAMNRSKELLLPRDDVQGSDINSRGAKICALI